MGDIKSGDDAGEDTGERVVQFAQQRALTRTGHYPALHAALMQVLQHLADTRDQFGQLTSRQFVEMIGFIGVHRFDQFLRSIYAVNQMVSLVDDRCAGSTFVAVGLFSGERQTVFVHRPFP